MRIKTDVDGIVEELLVVTGREGYSIGLIKAALDTGNLELLQDTVTAIVKTYKEMVPGYENL